MATFIEKLRGKSDSTKNKLAIFFAAALTLIIVFFWILGMRSAKTDETVKANSTKDELKPLFLIFKSAKDGIKEIKENSKNYKANSADAFNINQ